MADEKCKVCGEVEFHLNHFAFVGNVPISGGHAFEPVAAGRQEPRVVSKPPCHVCGEPMTVKEWKCRCGATTGCSEPSAPKVEPLCDCNKCRLARGAHPFFDGNHDACSKPEPVAGTQVELPECHRRCGDPYLGNSHHPDCERSAWEAEQETVFRVAGTASAPQVAVARCPKCEGTKFGWIKVYCLDCNKVHELRGRQMVQFFPAQPLRTPPAPECKGCKSNSEDYFEHNGCIIEKAVGKEQGRWQQAIYELCRKHAIAPDCIDGSGCDSGDPLDLTLTEIGQVICQLENPQDYRDPLPAQPITMPEKMQQEMAGLRFRIHNLEAHNQYFFRCESAWCHPADKEFQNPALESFKQAVESAAKIQPVPLESAAREIADLYAGERSPENIQAILERHLHSAAQPGGAADF